MKKFFYAKKKGPPPLRPRLLASFSSLYTTDNAKKIERNRSGAYWFLIKLLLALDFYCFSKLLSVTKLMFYFFKSNNIFSGTYLPSRKLSQMRSLAAVCSYFFPILPMTRTLRFAKWLLACLLHMWGDTEVRLPKGSGVKSLHRPCIQL